MNILTVFNYPDEEEYNIMCCAWIMQIRKYTTNKIIILTQNEIREKINLFISKMNYQDIEFRKLNSTNQIDFRSHPDFKKASHNVNFKLFNLCKIKEPYIFIDADAFLLNSIEPLIKAGETKPLIAVNHQIIPGETDHLKEPVLNSGVMVVSDPNFMVWENFLKILFRDQGFRWPGTDQSLINSFCKESNYDYTHKDIGHGWNSWAKYTVFEEGEAFCRGLLEEHRVFINHYWNKSKPWKVDCPIYKETKRLISNL
jgi:hypothetical protein